MENVNNNIATAETSARIKAEELNDIIASNAGDTTFGELFGEDFDAMLDKRIEELKAIKYKPITIASIADFRGVTNTCVVSYFNFDVEARTAIDNLKNTITAIGSGKPKMSKVEKAMKLGLSKADLEAMLASMQG